jgi:hypothetical protein
LNTIQQSHGVEPEAQDPSQEEKGKQSAAIPGGEGQAVIQEEKDKPPGAEPGGEVQARRKPQLTSKPSQPTSRFHLQISSNRWIILYITSHY